MKEAEQPSATGAKSPACGKVSDDVLVMLAKAGDSQAFATLLERNRARVFKKVRSMLRQTEDAQDTLQECFLKAWLSLDRFEGKAQFSTWLMRIAINEALMLIRKERRHHVCSALEIDISDSRPGPLQHYARSEANALLWRDIARLPLKLQASFTMRYVRDLSTNEMASSLAVTEAAVKSRLHRVRRHLRQRNLSRGVLAPRRPAVS